MFDHEPVLAVCGWSGSGKTTVLERVIPVLVGRGLRVAVVKHDAHGIDIDREGKDSARFFSVGADVHLSAPEECVWRSHRRVEESLGRSISRLLATHDLVLVEGHKETPLPKIWCQGAGDSTVLDTVSGVVATLGWDADRAPALLSIIDERVKAALEKRALIGGILIGGGSRRMGKAKQMITVSGQSMLSGIADSLRFRVEQVVILGRGGIPNDAGSVERLSDAPGTGQGPLAGLLTAFRWAPRACWVVAACDMPGMTLEALEWLIEQRRPGRWAIIPRDSKGCLQPTLALFEPQAGALIENLVWEGRKAPRGLARWSEVHTPAIPDSLSSAWLNVNTPEELEDYCSRR